METAINKRRLFNACSLALVVTALTFAIRANLMGPLGEAFGLTSKAIGEIASAAFWGFTAAMFAGGFLCDVIGLGKMYMLAFIGHIAGIILTIYATGYWSLFVSTLFVGLGNGFVESASYAMVSSMYTTDKTRKINAWHIWFPAGIVIGGVLAYLLTLLDFGWKIQMAVMLPPTILYGAMFLKQRFPKSERVSMGVSNREMIRECLRPLFIFMLFCMFLTAATELGTNQWIVELLSAVGVPSILLLVFINGIMTVGRANAGFILQRLSPTGLLLFSAIFSFFGLYWLGSAEGYVTFAAAGVFAIGICFFWPTMIGFVSEKLPKTGPLGLSLMGGAGLLSTALVLPYFGQLYDHQITFMAATENSLSTGQVKLAAGARTLLFISVIPAVLIVAFSILKIRSQKKMPSFKISSLKK
ncbi:MAG: MFS transporter [Chitinophagaceae bacterium]|nr:MFS transporter [Chitinophagaceae bacterium]